MEGLIIHSILASRNTLTILFLLVAAIGMLFTAACGKSPIGPTGDNSGKVIFWTDISDEGTIKIYVEDEYLGELTTYFPNGPPSSDTQTGVVVLSKPADTYQYTASNQNGRHWAGSVTIEANKTAVLKLDSSGPLPNTGQLPATLGGLPVKDQGTIGLQSKQVSISLWDWDLVDGDIITLVVNGQTVLSHYTLTGTKRVLNTTLNQGNNYIAIICISPGTTTAASPRIEINDGHIKQGFSILAYPNQVGGYNLIVRL